MKSELLHNRNTQCYFAPGVKTNIHDTRGNNLRFLTLRREMALGQQPRKKVR
jgi:hypothetical protein